MPSAPVKKLLLAFSFFFGALILSGCAQIPTSNKQPLAQATPAQSAKPSFADHVAKPGYHRVSKVVDGDTIDVDIDGKVERLRLIGMDTPETVDPRKVVQCFGREASDKAKEILSDQQVRLEADPTQGERDKYGRLLRYVFLEDGTLYNQFMISEGYAHEYTYQSKPYIYQDAFQQAQRQAREQKRSLWSPDTCNGDTTKAASTEGNKQPANQGSGDGAIIKKSRTGICHAAGTAYYAKTNVYTAFATLDECFASGGILPK